MEVEQVEVLAEPAVIALLGLLALLEPRVEALLVEERGAVDPLQRLVAVVTAPVRRRRAEQLDHADPARRGPVRTFAEVDPVAVAVQREDLGALADDVLDDLDLELLTLGGEQLDRLLRRDLGALEAQVRRDDRVGLGLDAGELVLRERLAAIEVVVEAVLDRRTDRDLGPREQPLHGIGDDVRRVVADGVERLGCLGREDLELGVPVERARQIHERAVRLREHRGLGEAGADRVPHEVADRRARSGLLLAAVGKGHGNAGVVHHGFYIRRPRRGVTRIRSELLL